MCIYCKVDLRQSYSIFARKCFIDISEVYGGKNHPFLKHEEERRHIYLRVKC